MSFSCWPREPDAPWGRIEITFTLDTQGRPTDLRITQSEPPGLLDDVAVRQILSSRFRPRMDRGRVIASQATVGWDFQYHPPPAQGVTAIGPAGP